ncbi:response regulator [Candidatus Dependentiae bacterium]|nr:response regulator [Candidatus Dependentiae bacterium]
MKQGALILVIDDEIQIRRFLRVSLEAYGYNVKEADCGQEGIKAAKAFRPDLIILDLGLPDINGIEVLKIIREWSSVPIIILTVCDEEQEKVDLLDAGSDDYLTKPFSMNELQARIRVALRHNSKSAGTEPVFKSGPIQIDFDKRIVTIENREIKLTPTEYSLLTLLARNAGKVITQTQIMKELWGENFIEETQYLRIYILQLRRKIEVKPSSPKLLITEQGVGYRLL